MIYKYFGVCLGDVPLGNDRDCLSECRLLFWNHREISDEGIGDVELCDSLILNEVLKLGNCSLYVGESLDLCFGRFSDILIGPEHDPFLSRFLDGCLDRHLTDLGIQCLHLVDSCILCEDLLYGLTEVIVLECDLCSRLLDDSILELSDMCVDLL